MTVVVNTARSPFQGLNAGAFPPMFSSPRVLGGFEGSR